MAGAWRPLEQNNQGAAVRFQFVRKLGKHLPAGRSALLGLATHNNAAQNQHAGHSTWLRVTIINTRYLKQFRNITHSFGFQPPEASQNRFLSSSALSHSVLCSFFNLLINQLWHKQYFHTSFLSPNSSFHMLLRIYASRDKPTQDTTLGVFLVSARSL